ncbi:MAG: TIGR00295 family protein [Thermoplasmata archaeon]|nr:MAG: TIGR00295 family protein [Thermoplasmata archaeon]
MLLLVINPILRLQHLRCSLTGTQWGSGNVKCSKEKLRLFLLKEVKRWLPVSKKRLPSPQECIKLLDEQGCSPEVVAHCKAVRDVAVKIAECTGADKELVEVGALLHDIGRSRTHGITHGLEGARIAREMGLPESVVRIIERHLGAGISKEEAKKLGLPPKDYTPKTLEEKIVAHADNLIERDRVQNIQVEIDRQMRNKNFEYAKKLRELHDELSALCGRDLNDLLR